MRQRWLANALFVSLGWACVLSASDAIEEISPGTWVKRFAAAKAELGDRTFATPVLLPDNRILIWGSPGAKQDWATAAYDIDANQWKPLLPEGKEAWLKARPKMRYAMPWGVATSLDASTGQPVPVKHFHQAVYMPSINQVLYAVGGLTLLFDPSNNVWTQVKTAKAPPMVLWGAACYDPVNREVVLFGGSAQNEAGRPGTWLFNPEARSWRPLAQPLDEQPPPRCNAPLAYDPVSKQIVVHGGDAHDHYRNDTWVYDCAQRKWRELKTDKRPYPRALVAFCALGKHGKFMMAGSLPHAYLKPGSSKRRPKAQSEEVWILDPAKATWTRVNGRFPAGAWHAAVYHAGRDEVLLVRTASNYWKYCGLEIHAWKPDFKPVDKGIPGPEKTVYKYLTPEWYLDTKEPHDPKAGEAVIAGLNPNVWQSLKPPKEAYARTWGTVVLDPVRHEVVLWGGGHSGYCGTDISHFSLKTLKWTTSFAPEFPALPYTGFSGPQSSFLLNNYSFNKRPWVQHGRISYAYDSISDKVVFTQSISRVPDRGFTYVYDPKKRDFVDRFPQPFIPGWGVCGLNVTTPHGVYNYLAKANRDNVQGLFKLDVKNRKWINVSDGRATVPGPESTRLVYDNQRDRLLLLSYKGNAKSSKPAMYAWELKSEKTEWRELPLQGDVPVNFYRESVYLVGHDKVVTMPRTLSRSAKGMLYVCDLANGNRWKKTGIQLPCGVGPGTGLVHDAQLDVLVLALNRTSGPCQLWMMKYKP